MTRAERLEEIRSRSRRVVTRNGREVHEWCADCEITFLLHDTPICPKHATPEEKREQEERLKAVDLNNPFFLMLRKS